jgi:hypothetical protein
MMLWHQGTFTNCTGSKPTKGGASLKASEGKSSEGSDNNFSIRLKFRPFFLFFGGAAREPFTRLGMVGRLFPRWVTSWRCRAAEKQKE